MSVCLSVSVSLSLPPLFCQIKKQKNKKTKEQVKQEIITDLPEWVFFCVLTLLFPPPTPPLLFLVLLKFVVVVYLLFLFAWLHPPFLFLFSLFVYWPTFDVQSAIRVWFLLSLCVCFFFFFCLSGSLLFCLRFSRSLFIFLFLHSFSNMFLFSLLPPPFFALTHIYRYSYKPERTHTHTYTYTHTRTQTYLHTNTYSDTYIVHWTRALC